MPFNTHCTEYNCWRKMRERCRAKSGRHYRLYAARGITVCQRWGNFRNFLEDMGPRPSPLHSLERKDNDGPYCKENCVWATQKEQCNNQRRNIRIALGGVTKTLKQWSEELGINYYTAYMRLQRGWPPDKALAVPSLDRSAWSTIKGSRAVVGPS